MLIRLLATSSVMHCRPASGHPAIAALFGREWGGLRIGLRMSGKSGIAGLDSIFYNGIFVIIQGLLNRDQRIPYNLSGKYRQRPVLT
ncbi:MAG: hypothetical protein IGS48_19465 [Oscillatoriales cyanobacterium C42_A2020_001]|nr:hypothetical protein [Leptolyngbyaceae cyanobacterium C42_A2020_001]